MLKIKGKKLIFISLICPDGVKMIDVSNKDMSVWDDDIFTLNRLSLTQDNYIASGMNTYVVKLKH